METFLHHTLKETRQQGLYRTLRHLQSVPDSRVIVDGHQVIQFSSNNYLGLANHPALKQAAKAAIEQYGVGSAASRLITGNITLYDQLEDRLARFKGTEAAIVFPTGYQTNIGTIASLMGPEDLIFSDALNHASIIDGCRLSEARVLVYPHRDVEALENMIRTAAPALKKLIITDGVFSMDGTLAPLPGLTFLAKKYDCWLMVDEAHATGVYGTHGRGTAEHFSVEGEVDIHMGTFSKALGSLGGYVAGSRRLIDFLINKCRNLIYTTGLPPAVLAANQAAIDLVEKDGELRKGLWDRVHFFRSRLISLGFNTLQSETQIIPVVTGDPELTMEFSRYLFEQGILAHGIRPPTVPQGLSRIRIAIMATHAWEDLARGLEVLEKAGTQFKII
ncbi:MAG: 8-amino-7-oxononanoate synthase [Deltaproteobacteria bacterium]|nr:8-amino-7-oxononanoate synthase [Deltaproteobacteria bacterium]